LETNEFPCLEVQVSDHLVSLQQKAVASQLVSSQLQQQLQLLLPPLLPLYQPPLTLSIVSALHTSYLQQSF
jgi:hypothetical protein